MGTTRYLLGGAVAAVLGMLSWPALAQIGGVNAPPPPPGGPGGGPGRFGPSPEQIDRNQDGRISAEEHGFAWDGIISEQFKKIDANSDGSLSKEEQEKAPGPGRGPHGEGRGPRGEGRGPEGGGTPPPPPPPPGMSGDRERPPMPPRMEDMDANKDGKVANDEYMVAWKKFMQEQFKRMDVNGDGILYKDELEKTKGPGRRGSGGPQGPGGPEL